LFEVLMTCWSVNGEQNMAGAAALVRSRQALYGSFRANIHQMGESYRLPTLFSLHPVAKVYEIPESIRY
jgi:hypothetical protein